MIWIEELCLQTVHISRLASWLCLYNVIYRNAVKGSALHKFTECDDLTRIYRGDSLQKRYGSLYTTK